MRRCKKARLGLIPGHFRAPLPTMDTTIQYTHCELAALGKIKLPPAGLLEPWVHVLVNHLRWALDLVICELRKTVVIQVCASAPDPNCAWFVENQAVRIVRECLADVWAGAMRFACMFPYGLRDDLRAFWDRFQALNCASRLLCLSLDTSKPAPKRSRIVARGIVRNPSPLAHSFSASDLRV